jgi:hypothetical protein
MAEFYNLWKSKDIVVQELEALIEYVHSCKAC